MPVESLAADKPKILFFAAMMAIQNYGFFEMYFSLFPFIPASVDGGLDCETLRFWVGFFSIDCFVESFCVLWMAMVRRPAPASDAFAAIRSLPFCGLRQGGYIDSKCMFAFGWILHLVVALPYSMAAHR